jgi:hypothetical protein
VRACEACRVEMLLEACEACRGMGVLHTLIGPVKCGACHGVRGIWRCPNDGRHLDDLEQRGQLRMGAL